MKCAQAMVLGNHRVTIAKIAAKLGISVGSSHAIVQTNWNSTNTKLIN
jgi:hypothetical protein